MSPWCRPAPYRTFDVEVAWMLSPGGAGGPEDGMICTPEPPPARDDGFTGTS